MPTNPEDLSGPYARDAGWSGGGSRDDYVREPGFTDHRGDEPSDVLSGRDADAHVSNHLANDPAVDVENIVVSVSDGEVTLTGIVASSESKARAEQLVRQCGGVRDVFNHLRVDDGASVHIGKASE